MKLSKLLLFIFALAASSFAQSDARYTRAAEWEKDIAAFEDIDRQQTPPQDAVLFTGSSSIRMWTGLRKDFPAFKVINRGFGGSRLEDLVFFAPRIVRPYKPKVIVVYSGENDIEGGRKAEDVLNDFKAFVAFRDRTLPGTPVIYVSMKPSVLRWKIWPEMKRGNDLIAREAVKHSKVEFANVAEKMLGPDGDPMPDIFLSDGLHMNLKGYEIWRSCLLPIISKFH